MQAEDRRGGRKHRGNGHGEGQGRPAQHGLHDPAPEASLRGAGATEVPAEDRNAQRVDAVADDAQQRGQEGQRGRDRDDSDEDRSEREAPHDRGRDDEHADQRDDERAAAEEHRATGGGAGSRDRIFLRQPEPPLLAIAGDDEEGVVDPERQAHPREHVDDEHGERELERQERDEPERDDDREDRHQHGHEPGDNGAEDEHEHDQRGGQAEGQLALLEVGLRLLAEVVVHRAVAGDADLEAGVVRLLDNPLDGRGAGVADDPQ